MLEKIPDFAQGLVIELACSQSGEIPIYTEHADIPETKPAELRSG
jgi:hypothetical protein